MAVTGAIVAAGATVYTAVETAEAGREQKKAAEQRAIAETAAAEEQARLVEQNIALQKAESEEALTRMQKSQKQLESLGRAKASALGLKGTGSPDVYLKELEKTHRGELDWLRKSGASKAEIMAQEGKYMSQLAKSRVSGILAVGESAAKRGRATGVGQFGQAISQTGTAGKEAGWWG